MRVEYNDDALNIIDKVNDELSKHGITFEFVDDGQEHDGFEVFEFRSTNPCKCVVTDGGLGIDMNCPIHSPRVTK